MRLAIFRGSRDYYVSRSGYLALPSKQTLQALSEQLVARLSACLVCDGTMWSPETGRRRLSAVAFHRFRERNSAKPALAGVPRARIWARSTITPFPVANYLYPRGAERLKRSINNFQNRRARPLGRSESFWVGYVFCIRRVLSG